MHKGSCLRSTGKYKAIERFQGSIHLVDIQLQFFNEYKKENKTLFDSDIWNFISLVWESPCQLAITTVQDLLELDQEARFNIPGTQKGNWKWRIKDLELLNSPLDMVKELNIKNNRANV